METNERTKFIYMGDSQCAKIGEKTYDYSGWQKLLDHACALLNAEQEPTQQGGGSAQAKYLPDQIIEFVIELPKKL